VQRVSRRDLVYTAPAASPGHRRPSSDSDRRLGEGPRKRGGRSSTSTSRGVVEPRRCTRRATLAGQPARRSRDGRASPIRCAYAGPNLLEGQIKISRDGELHRGSPAPVFHWCRRLASAGSHREGPRGEQVTCAIAFHRERTSGWLASQRAGETASGIAQGAARKKTRRARDPGAPTSSALTRREVNQRLRPSPSDLGARARRTSRATSTPTPRSAPIFLLV
jgi:hypothetical protein